MDTYKKKYEEALERARLSRLQLLDIGEEATEIEYIFPELKEESEDEKIRKELITHCRNTRCVTEEGAERIAKWLAWLEKQAKQKTIWNEEDEHRIKLLEALCEDKLFESVPNSTMYGEMRKTIDWLNFLRPQPKQEWNEDDKRILDALITSLVNERFAGRLEFLKGIKVSSVIDWLKSLKEKIKGE